jgi:hypothetical protein
MRRALLLAVLALGLRSAAPGQELEIPREPELSIFAGFGHTVKVNHGQTDAWVLEVEPQVAFRLGTRFQWLAEGHYAHWFDPNAWAAGLLPLGARYYFGTSRRSFYLDFLAGLGWTNLQVVEIDRRFNFILTGGPGLRGQVDARHAWFVQARWLHYSNAGTVRPNLGLNAAVVSGGWKF